MAAKSFWKRLRVLLALNSVPGHAQLVDMIEKIMP